MYREGFVYAYPMQSKSQGGEALNVVTRDIGVSNTQYQIMQGNIQDRRKNYRNA